MVDITQVNKNGFESSMIIVDTSEAGFNDLCEQMASKVVICKNLAALEAAFAEADAVASKFGKTPKDMKLEIVLEIARRAM